MMGKYDNNQKEAEDILQKLMEKQSDFDENYPELSKELEQLRHEVYGEVTVTKQK
jgi:hypothetical protein